MTLTPAQTIALSAFRRSNFAAHVKTILNQELAARRAAYLDDDLTKAALARAGARDVRDVMDILFDKEI